LNIYSTGQ